MSNEQFAIFLDLLHSQLVQAKETIEANVADKLDKRKEHTALTFECWNGCANPAEHYREVNEWDELQPLYDVLDDLARYSRTLERQ